jgi:hypothetical protein
VLPALTALAVAAVHQLTREDRKDREEDRAHQGAKQEGGNQGGAQKGRVRHRAGEAYQAQRGAAFRTGADGRMKRIGLGRWHDLRQSGNRTGKS